MSQHDRHDTDPLAPEADAAEEAHDGTVGYRRPPRAHTFKRGRSGNPRGRPKGARSTSTIVASLLAKKVTLNSSGRRRQVAVKEAIITAWVNAALKGDLKAAAALLALEERLAPAAESPDQAATDHEDGALIAGFLARQGSTGEG